MGRQRATVFSISMFLVLIVGLIAPLAAQDPSAVGSVTWQQDSPAICQGCVYRTGANLAEATLTYKTVAPTSFGQFCNYKVDGEIYGQPLVVRNVTFNGVTGKTVVFVVTQNDSVYAFDGQPTAPGNYPAPQCTLLAGPISLLGSGETPINCSNFGGGGCTTIAQVIGMVGTPVIQTTGSNPTTGRIYVVAHSVTGGGTYYHRVWSVDISSLSLTTAISNTVTIPSACPIGQGGAFSKIHIQRPALLLGGDGYLYVAFSMMDGLTTPYPNGMMLAYNTNSFSSTQVPLCLNTSEGQQDHDGGGIWQGGAGPAYGPDGTGATDYVYFNTANGTYDGTSNWGDSFIRMTTASSGALQVSGSSTPADQLARSHGVGSGGQCNTDDIDFGSGGVTLIPERENTTYPYMAVSGDKEGGMWFFNRANPGAYNGDGTCSGGNNNTNIQTPAINGVGLSNSGPVIHTSGAFWESGGSSPTNYLFMSSQANTGTDSGKLMRYQICDSLKPIRNSASPPCTATGAYAYDPTNPNMTFYYGATPTITATSATDTDALVWAIDSDGSVVPNTDQFKYPPVTGKTFNPAKNGVLYAFDAANTSDPNMKKLYASTDCLDASHQPEDQILPATKFSVPTISNGYVYLGTMGPKHTSTSNGTFPNNLDFNAGTFYIFGYFGQNGRVCH